MSARRKAESLILTTSSGQGSLRISQSGERKTGLRMSQSGRRRQSTHKPVYVTAIGRTNAGINKAESFQGRRSAVRFSWLHLPRDLVQPNVDSIYLRQCGWYQTDEPSVKDGVQMVILLVDHAPLTYGGSGWCVTSWSGGMSVWVLFIGGGTTYLSNAYPGDVIPFCMMLNNDTSRYSRELPGVRNVTPGLPKAVNDICIPTAGAIAF